VGAGCGFSHGCSHGINDSENVSLTDTSNPNHKLSVETRVQIMGVWYNILLYVIHFLKFRDDPQYVTSCQSNLTKGRIAAAHGQWYLYFAMVRLFSQSCPFSWGSGPQSNTRFLLGPTRFTPKRHLDQFSRFCRAHNRDRPTDRPIDHLPATIGCIYVLSTAMRPKKYRRQR